MVYFRDSDIITKDDIRNFYLYSESNLTETTLNWRIHCLIKSEIIFSFARGKYMLRHTNTYLPAVSGRLLRLWAILKKRITVSEYCLWETDIFKSFSSSINAKNAIVLEVTKSKLRETFLLLSELKKPCMINPSEEEMLFMRRHFRLPVFIFQLLRDAPLVVTKGIQVPAPEKIIVDLFVRPEIVELKKLNDIEKLIHDLGNVHTFNTSKVMRYAARRNKKNEISDLLKSLNNIV